MDTQNNREAPLASPLADPTTFGEDLRSASRRALELAPLNCGACQNYHIFFPIKRHLSTIASMPDRNQLVAAIGELLVERAGKGDGKIDVVVVGAADSGVLAVCAHAAHIFLGDASRRVRFTVLDRCPTPLALCSDYALRNDIALDVHAVDLVLTTNAFPADVIVHHSLISFIEPENHETILKKFAGWLKPQGRIVFSTEIRSASIGNRYVTRRSQRAKQIRASVESGAFIVDEPLDIFYARFNSFEAAESAHVFDFVSTDQVQELFLRTGLVVLSSDRILDSWRLANGCDTDRERVIALLAAPAEK